MTSTKPPFLNPKGTNDLPLVPPVFLEGMSARVLPLAARVGALQRFLDYYVNMVPPQVGRFRAISPYVYLMVLDYGKLAAQASNLGWFAQREVLFSVPANHYTLCGDRWVFQGVAWFAPFIFVDSDVSMTLGRRVYGWTKLRHNLAAETSTWIRNPGAGQRLVVLTTPVFGKLYSGQQQEAKVFCEIISLPDRTLEYPPRLDGKLMPWTMARNLAEVATDAVRDGQELFEAAGNAPAQPDVFFAQAMNLLNSLNPLNPDIRSRTFNLKQFRDAGRPSNYCYQALTATNMRVVKLNHFGPLGQPWRGFDSSAGFRVHLHSWPILPIAETLGLYVENQWRTDGVEVSEIKVVNPFWYDVDMIYETGVNLAERTHDGIWRTSHGSYENPDRRAARKQARADAPGTKTATDARLEDALFNTTLGASTLTVPGPYSFLDTTVRVFPLLADVRAVSQFLDESLNLPLASERIRFELWGPPPESLSEGEDPHRAYVYLVITNWGKVHSSSDDIGDWKGDELCFYVPVRYYRDEKLEGVGLVPAATYASGMTAMIVNTELLGWSTKRATFERPATAWLDDPSDQCRQPLLRIITEVLPTLSAGQPIEDRELLDITDGLPPELLPRLVREWAPAMRREVEAANLALSTPNTDLPDGQPLRSARMLALGVLVEKVPISIYTIKQFRDVATPERACYQSFTRVQRTIQHLDRLDRLPATMAIKIFEYDSTPIVKLFGLKTSLVQDPDGRHAHLVIPQHPFWARFSCREALPECIYYRVSEQWKRGHDYDGWKPFLSDETFGELKLNRMMVENADHGDSLDPFRPGDHQVRWITPNEGLDPMEYLPLVEVDASHVTHTQFVDTLHAVHLSAQLNNFEQNLRTVGSGSDSAPGPDLRNLDVGRVEREIWSTFEKEIAKIPVLDGEFLLAYVHRLTAAPTWFEQVVVPHPDFRGEFWRLVASSVSYRFWAPPWSRKVPYRRWLGRSLRELFIRTIKTKLLQTENDIEAIARHTKEFAGRATHTVLHIVDHLTSLIIDSVMFDCRKAISNAIRPNSPINEVARRTLSDMICLLNLDAEYKACFVAAESAATLRSPPHPRFDEFFNGRDQQLLDETTLEQIRQTATALGNTKEVELSGFQPTVTDLTTTIQQKKAALEQLKEWEATFERDVVKELLDASDRKLRFSPEGAVPRVVVHCAQVRAHADEAQQFMQTDTASRVLRKVDLQMIIESVLAQEWCSQSAHSPRKRTRNRLVQERHMQRRGLSKPRECDKRLLDKWFDELVDDPQAQLDNMRSFTAVRHLHDSVAAFAESVNPSTGAWNSQLLARIFEQPSVWPKSSLVGDDPGWSSPEDELPSGVPGVGRVLFLICDLFRTLKLLLETSWERRAGLAQDLCVLAEQAYDAEIDRLLNFLACRARDPNFFVDTTMFGDAAAGNFEMRYQTADGKYAGSIFTERKHETRDRLEKLQRDVDRLWLKEHGQKLEEALKAKSPNEVIAVMRKVGRENPHELQDLIDEALKEFDAVSMASDQRRLLTGMKAQLMLVAIGDPNETMQRAAWAVDEFRLLTP